MNSAIIAIFTLQCTLGGAFALGFFLPLAMAGFSERQQRTSENRSQPSVDPLNLRWGAVDLLLIASDAIPLFWLWRFCRHAPDDSRAAAKMWRQEPSIRLCFYLAISLLLTLPLYFLL